jgi:hypothetical protein
MYLIVGWVRGTFITGLGPVVPRAGPIGAGLANWAAFEKCGMAPKLPPPLPGGLAHAAWIRVMHAVGMMTAQVDVFIYLINPPNVQLLRRIGRVLECYLRNDDPSLF